MRAFFWLLPEPLVMLLTWGWASGVNSGQVDCRLCVVSRIITLLQSGIQAKDLVLS